jgi:hypothetical protein
VAQLSTLGDLHFMKIQTISTVIAAAILVAGCKDTKHTRAYEAAQKKIIPESLVIVYASADTTHLPKIRLVVREIWKGSAEAPAIGVTNGMELLLNWGARDGNPPDHAVVCFPQGVSSSTASESYTEYPVRGGKVSGIWSIQEFKSKFGL